MHCQHVVTVNPLVKLFRDSALPETGYAAEAVRGEIVSLQLALKLGAAARVRLANPVVLAHKNSRLTGTMNFIGFVPVRQNTPDTPSGELERGAPAFFPDPILEDEELDVQAGDTCPVWVTVPIPQDREHGTYRGMANILCGQKKLACELTVIVHKARLPEKRNLFVTNWFWPDKVASYYKIEPWSERHWQYIDAVAKDLSAHRQNVILTHLYDLLDIYDDNGALRIDFNKFDRWVDVFDRYGVAERIEGSHLGVRELGAWEAEHFVLNPVTIRKTDGSVAGRLENIRAGTDRARRFLEQFLPALRDHLAQRGWLERYIQHIADEPTNINAASWRSLSDETKRFIPGIRRIDAVMCDSLKGSIDIWTPRLDQLDEKKDFFRSCINDREEVWFYTCLFPRGSYPNRFIDFSLMKTRLLPWINFRYSLSGYLHWGYNWWSGEPFVNVEPDQVSGGALPPGDNAIVYPGRNGPLSSVRWEMFRKGIEDYELLRCLSETRPELARKLASQTVPGIKNCIRDANAFNALRLAMIGALDAGCNNEKAP